MKTTLSTILLLTLSAPVFGQTQRVRAVDPIRIEIVTQGEAPHDQELDKLIRHELRKTRRVVITRRSRRSIHFAVTEITSKGQPIGFASTMLMLDDGDVAYLSIFIESDLPSLASRMADHLKQELTK